MRLIIVSLAAASLFSACGSSHEATSTSTASTPTTTPPPTTTTVARGSRFLVAESYPTRFTGSLTFNVDRTHGDPRKPLGWRREYAITLTNVSLRLASVTGKGLKRTARYVLTGARARFSGFEDSTTLKCQTTHIVWGGRPDEAINGALEIFGTTFSSAASYDFDVPERGATTTRQCRSKQPGRRATVIRTIRITGNGSLQLAAGGAAQNRFVLFVEVQSATKGPVDKGGYTINGSFRVPTAGAPVTVCSRKSGRLECPAS